jgi:hypothetical protein
MKRFGLILLLMAIGFAAHLPTKADPIVGEVAKPTSPAVTDHVLISAVGDIRAILGGAGKNIGVSNDGNAVAVLYGDPTTSADDPMEIKIGYSLNGGAVWTTYGPFSPELRRIYPGLDGSDDFDAMSGELYYMWQESPYGYNEGDLKVMIEEGTPAASSPSSPFSLPHAADVYPWLGSIAVNPEDPYNVIATGWAYLNGGDLSVFCWISDDGGYTWSDSIRMLDPINDAGATGPIRFGPGDYVIYTFQDLYDIGGGTEVIYPYYIESTDGGYTWSSPATLPVPYVTSTAQFWWHENDVEVIDGEPWTVFTDLDADSMWLFHGTGSPGAWSWTVHNIRQLGSESVWIGTDTFKFCHPSQYPSVCYDDVSGRIAIVYKGNYYIGDNVTWAIMNGAHVGGVYTDNDGVSWTTAWPMSTLNTGGIVWGDWNASETAYNIVDNATYTAWVNESELNLYFAGGPTEGQLQPFLGVEEVTSNIVHYNFNVTPNITDGNCRATFSMPHAGTISLKLFDATGRLINDVYNGQLNQGNQSITVNTVNLAAGTYFVVLETEAGNDAKKLIRLH